MKAIARLLMVVSFSILFISCAQADKEPLPKEQAKEAAIDEAISRQFKKLAPDFELQDTRQDIVSLKDYRGKQPVLLFFWTTLCPLCEEELKIINDTYASLVSDGLEVLAIDVAERPSRVQAFIQSFHLTYRVLLDMDTSVAVAYRVFGVPTYVLVNKAGEIVFQDNYFPRNFKKFLLR